MPETSEKGLTAAEVAALTESGQVNAVKSSTSRSFADIVRANVFTLFNGIIFAAMVMVLVTGSWRDAVFGLVILINTGIGIITELKAKRTLDKLSILVASDYLVRRDGKDVEVPHNEIVLGDLMWIRSGEQVPADAQIVRTGARNSTNPCSLANRAPCARTKATTSIPDPPRSPAWPWSRSTRSARTAMPPP